MNLYVLKDKDGDTALHLALKDLHEKTEVLMFQHCNKNYVSHSTLCDKLRRRYHRSMSFSEDSTRLMNLSACLVNANKDASFLANKDDISPLYLAVEAGNLSLVNAMLNRHGNNVQGKISELEGKKSLVHVALKAKSIDVLDVILNEEMNLVNERDEGQTCLSVGASVGFYEGICKLLDRSISSAFECNDDGSFPIHIAAEKGHVDVVEELLKRCPDSIEYLNKEGQNILHIAAKRSRKVVTFILNYIKKLDTKNHLMEEQDVNGNTPLHLATLNWRPNTVYELVMFGSTKTRSLTIRNADGLRPLDIAEENLHSDYIYGRYNMWLSMQSFFVALVATMTFAAGFTMPGGYNSSSPNPGMAIFESDVALSIFMVCDIVAMYSSVVAIIALIWAQLRDQELAQRALNVALPSLLLAVYFMSFAFFFGVRAATVQNKILSVILTTISVFFSVTIFFLLAPYVMPQVSGISFIQGRTNQYLIILMWLVNEDMRPLAPITNV